MLPDKDRPYPCTECHKCFRSSNNLREHLRIHTGERPYKCRVCEQTFTTSGTRGRHEKIHGAALKLLKFPPGKKRYACTRCSEYFSGVAARIKHMKKSHKLTGHYFCLQCDIELMSVDNLVEHHDVVHSYEKGKSSWASSLLAEHEDHAYHRYPLNDVNLNSSDDFDQKMSMGNLVSKRSKGYSRIQRKSLLKLRRICLKARKRNAASNNEFICRYCEERFSKLSLFLKHLWKHSKAKSKTMVESDQTMVKTEMAEEADVIIEGEITDNSHHVIISEDVEVVEGDDITVESKIIDNNFQRVIMPSEILLQLPMVELKNENTDCLTQKFAAGTTDENTDLQQFVKEIMLHKHDYELQEVKQLQDETETLSPGYISGKNPDLDESNKQDSCFSKSGNKLVRHDPSLDRLGGVTISPSHSRIVATSGETARIATNNEDAIYDEVIYHGDKEVTAVHKFSTESNPESMSISSLENCRHILDLNKSQIFCELCGKKVKNSARDDGCNKAVYTCVECDQLFSSLQQLQDSSDMEALESLSLDVQDGFRQKPKHKPNLCRKTHSCSHCNMKFNTKKMCNLHETTCTAEKPLSECDTPSSDNFMLRQSKVTVPYWCTVCSRPFAFKYRLERHMLTHTGEKPFKCSECGKAYTSNEYLKSHKARHFNEYTHLCSTCGKSFADRLAWRLHKRVHEIAKRTKNLPFREYMCWLCGFQFRHASNLTKHLQRHRLKDEFPYKCGECDQQFRTKEGVRFHVGTHALEKPYLCMECPKAFPDSWCLKIHSRSHTKLGSFECSVCYKKYRTMSSLRTHSRHHTDMRYTCEVCGETFGFSRKYRSHLIKHRPPFQCEVCGVTTTRAAGLRKHKKRFHHFQ